MTIKGFNELLRDALDSHAKQKEDMLALIQKQLDDTYESNIDEWYLWGYIRGIVDADGRR